MPSDFVAKVTAATKPKELGNKYFSRYSMKTPTKSSGKRRPISIPFAIDEDDNVISCSFEMGAAGSGKSTLLHTIISGLIMNYHPDEVELWLMDFKMLEFKRYVDHRPPHVKYILLEKSEDLVFDIIDHLTERGYKGRTVGFIENGSWAPTAAKIMRGLLEGSKDITFLETTCSIRSAMNSENASQLDAMADELCKDYTPSNKNDLTALFKIGYGLYVVTCNDGKKDNGLIVNTVTQVSDSPKRISVTINKANYSHHVIKQSGKLNVNCLTTSAPFSIFEKFGFASGRSIDKFEGDTVLRSENGLVYLDEYVNSYMSLTVEQYVDLGSHGMFICTIDEAKVLNNDDTMTYSYYHANVKPKPKTEGKKGYVCKICGYVYEGDTLPEDFVCPLCKHPASDFEPIK